MSAGGTDGKLLERDLVNPAICVYTAACIDIYVISLPNTVMGDKCGYLVSMVQITQKLFFS